MPRKYNVHATHVTKKDDTTLNVVQRFKELDSLLLFFLLKIKKNYGHLLEKNLSEFKFIIITTAFHNIH